jgi:hypothetical protein
MYRWKACLGDCKDDFGFRGGIREFILLHDAIEVQDAIKAKNMIFTYDNTFKAYFRFQNMNDKFSKDEFVDRKWSFFKNEPEDPLDYLGIDIIPNDVCPSINTQLPLINFDGQTALNELTLDIPFEQISYEYTFSMTLNVNSTTCFTRDPITAATDCNIFHLSDAFMLYFEMPNMLRFHFFASKNYYESQSKSIFIPYD